VRHGLISPQNKFGLQAQGRKNRLQEGRAQSIGPNRALIRYGGEHGYPSKVRIRCGTNAHTLAEAVIMCDAMYKRDNKSPEGLNWFSGRVIIKAQRARPATLGVGIHPRWSTASLWVEFYGQCKTWFIGEPKFDNEG
ncbi:hypothetical protein DVH24_005328, partial [Malus domestica]